MNKDIMEKVLEKLLAKYPDRKFFYMHCPINDIIRISDNVYRRTCEIKLNEIRADIVNAISGIEFNAAKELVANKIVETFINNAPGEYIEFEEITTPAIINNH